MATFAYFLHPPRDNFAETMTEHEQQAWGQHFAWLQELYAAGQLVLVGVTLGRVNTGVAILEAADESRRAGHRRRGSGHPGRAGRGRPAALQPRA